MNNNINVSKKELCDKIRQMKQEMIKLQQKCHSLENDNKILKQKNNWFAAKCGELERDNISKNKKFGQQNEELISIKKEIKRIKIENYHIKKEKKDIEDKIVVLNKRISSKDTEILLARNNAKIFQNDSDDFQNRCTKIAKKADLLISRCDMLQKSNDDKQEIIADILSKNKKLVEKATKYFKESNRCYEVIKNQTKKIKEYEKLKIQNQFVADELGDKISELKMKLSQNDNHNNNDNNDNDDDDDDDDMNMINNKNNTKIKDYDL